jgi:prepilin-type processing-associated H-X9-DG protein
VALASVCNRHTDGNNFTFADGHAKWVPVAKTRQFVWSYSG